MDLICTIYTPSKRDIKQQRGPLQSKWSYEGANLCSVSSQNTLLFVSSFPLESSYNAAFSDYSSAMPGMMDSSGQPSEKLSSFTSKSGKAQWSNDGSASNCLHHVFVADLNTPWDAHRVTSRASEITALIWEPDTASAFLLADKDGTIEIWQMVENVITEWRCNIRTNQFSAEMFIKAYFVPTRRKAFLNMDKLDSSNFSDKFTFRSWSNLSSEFGRRDLSFCILVSHTGLVVALAFNLGQDQCADGSPDGGRGINSGLKICSKSLAHCRIRIKHADIGFLKDGTLLAATTNGDPKSQVRFFSLTPEIIEFDEKFTLGLKVETFPGLFLQSPTMPPTKGISSNNDEDSCQAIVGLKFVNGDDCDTILVASHHPSGGRVELWELRELPHSMNKMFLSGNPDAAHNKKIIIPAWHYVEVFTGPAAQVQSLSTPSSAFQTGRGAACYVTVAYSDGSIQCLLRDSLQQIGSADLPKTGNLCEEPSAKMARASVTICDMDFTSTGNAIVVIDSLGQLYMYRMSPISDPGGLHGPNNLVTMLEYCLVSGYDWWDLTICAKPSHLEAICDRLTQSFNRQPQALQQFHWSRFMTIKSSMLRLTQQSSIDPEAGDTYTMLMLQSVHQVFKSLLRPTDTGLSDQSVIEKVSVLLSNAKKDETDVDKLVLTFSAFGKDLQVEPKYLQPFQHLIQWVANLALHLMAGVPEMNHRKISGTSLSNDKRALTILRELLLLIRIWGTTREGILPQYTRLTESFDVIQKLFFIITKFKENPVDEALQDECIMLPSHVIIPPLNTSTNPKGISPIVVMSHNLNPMSFEFCGGDIFDAQCSATSNSTLTNMNRSLVDAGISAQVMDCVRQIYLGRRPYVAKQCTRCNSMTLPISSIKDARNPIWEKRWMKNCPCGGPWKLACLEE